MVERDGATGELCNVVTVSQESPFRLQLPQKVIHVCSSFFSIKDQVFCFQVKM